MHARSEPLLWLQLIAVGVLPLEALLLLLLLAGSDPGPVPALERLLCWGLGGLLPALGLWRRPADVWSLLLLQTPLRARRPLQQRLSALQEVPALRLGLVAGSALLLALLWWSDDHAAIAGPFSPLAASPRLVALLLAALLLAVMLWQWQQLLQSLWLLSRSPGAIAAAAPLCTRELEARRLCLGLPLLLIDSLPERRPQSGTQPRQARPLSQQPGPIKAPAAPAASPAGAAAAEPQGDSAASGSKPVLEPDHTPSELEPQVQQKQSAAARAQGEANAQGLASAAATNDAPAASPGAPPAAAAKTAISDSPAGIPAIPTPAAPSLEKPLQASQAAPASQSDQDGALSPAVDAEATPAEATRPEPLGIESLGSAATEPGTGAEGAPTLPGNTAAAGGSQAAPAGTATLAVSPGPDDGEPVPSAAVPIAIEPEQRAEDGQGRDLDQQIG